MLVAVAVWSAQANASPQVRLEAEVRPDLQTIVGTMTLIDGAGLRLVDGLSKLPVPDDDQLRRLTFPGPVESGWLHISPDGDGRWIFHAVLPRRYGAAGTVPGRGLFANGLWHPTLMRGTKIATVEWDAIVELPPDHTGVLNQSVSERIVRWTGTADRLSLAVMRDARVQTLDLPAGEVTLVDQGPRREPRDLRLTELIRNQWPGPGAPNLVVVETPSRRRLARPGPGVLFLSDRAFRVSGGLWVYHWPAVRWGVYMAGLPITDSWTRSLAAAGLADAAAASDRDLRDNLGWVSWVPQIDDLLYSGRLPFYSEVFNDTWPADRVRDDLAEVLDPRSPGRAVTRRIDIRYGAGTAERLAWHLAQGVELQQATSAVGVPLGEVIAWRRLPPAEQLSVHVAPATDEWDVVIVRDAPPDVPPEPIVIEVDGQRVVMEATGDDRQLSVRVPERPKSVRVDPDGLVRTDDRADDRWPARWTTIAYLWWSDFSLRGGGLDAGGNLVFRKQYATRNRFSFTGAISPQDAISGGLTWYHHFGPLQDRRTRPFRLWCGAGPALLNPDYRPTANGRVAVDVYTGLAWSTMVDAIFPRKGHRVAVAATGGQVLQSDALWGSVRTSASAVQGIWGRVALAGSLRGGLATGQVEHRLLSLGGSSAVQGLTASAAVGRQLGVGALELRWQPLRGASVPLPLAWLSDVQLHGGADAGVVAGVEHGTAESLQAIGWTGGIAFTADVLGARPTMLGLWGAGPAWLSDVSLQSDQPLQLYLRMHQAF